MTENFRERVLAALESKRVTAAELARVSGVNYNVIVNLKRRPDSSTSTENGLKLIEALDKIEGNAPTPQQPTLGQGRKPITVEMDNEDQPTLGLSEAAPFQHAPQKDLFGSDVRVQMIDGKLVIQAKIGDAAGMESLLKMIDPFKDHWG